MLFPILCLLVFLGACSEQKEITQLQDRNGLMFQSNRDKPFTGTFVEYSVFGQKKKRAEKNYKDGKLDGLSILWNRSGQKDSEAHYKNGQQNGLETVWYMNGQKASEGNYKDGKRHGLWNEWYTKGLKWKEGNYKQGKKDGAWTAWDENGKVDLKETYTNGVLVKK